MILGIGSDLADIRRIESTLNRFGQRFTARTFTAGEIERAERQKHPANSYAKRWAAKEACAKALGTGLAQGVGWRDIEVSNLASGQPEITLTGGAAERLGAMLPGGHTPRIHLSLTDDPPYAQAFVVIEALPSA